MSKKSELTKQKVLEAAMEEFALMGYINGSTNTIAERASVSKGVVFHYFGSKKQLYICCFESAYNTFREYLFNDPKIFGLTDLFERMYYIGLLKREFYRENEKLSKLIFEANKLPEKDEYKDIKEIAMTYIRKAFDALYENVDLSSFKPAYRNHETLSFIISVLLQYFTGIEKRYENDIMSAIEDYDNILAEAKKLMDLLKYGVFMENEGLEMKI